MAEEQSNPARTLPRAIISGTLPVSALYLTINFALLRVLPLPVLAASELPAADAARVVFPRGGAGLVTLISLFTILSLLNTEVLMAPRILFSIGRAGLFSERDAPYRADGDKRDRCEFDPERYVRADHRAQRGSFLTVLRVGFFGSVRVAPSAAHAAPPI
jgi:hypothetical protein